MSQKTIKPVSGRRVRDPDGALLPAGGKTVTWCAFWEQRLRDGDIEVAEEPANPNVKEK